jgi:hypothetical protein
MPQNDLGSIPDPTTGASLVTLLKNWRDALHSLHRGAARPSYAVAGTAWLKENSASDWRLMIWDGADTDIQIGVLNPTANTWTPSIANGAIVAAMLAANIVDTTKVARQGTAGQVLTSGGPSVDPSWQTPASATDRVSKAGDTMTGNLVMSGTSKLRGSGSTAATTGIEISGGADIGGLFVRSVSVSSSGSGNGVASISVSLSNGVLTITQNLTTFSVPSGGGGS